jgi:hypothetical protein
MLTALLAAALTLQAAPAAPTIAQDQRALLRCAAAFAIVSDGQAKGRAEANRWPVLGTRGREFFVRALAQLMDQTGLDRDAVSRLASSEAQSLRERGEVDRIMPSCLTMLELSGL